MNLHAAAKASLSDHLGARFALTFCPGIEVGDLIGREAQSNDMRWLGAPAWPTPAPLLQRRNVVSSLSLIGPGCDLLLGDGSIIDRLALRHAISVIRKCDGGTPMTRPTLSSIRAAVLTAVLVCGLSECDGEPHVISVRSAGDVPASEVS